MLDRSKWENKTKKAGSKKQGNFKIKNLCLDKIQLNTPYAFTYNPKDQFWGNTNANRLTQIQATFKKRFRLLHPEYRYLVRWEFSPVGHWHCHGIIYYYQYPLMFYGEELHNITGEVALEIDTISCINTWLVYMYKQKKMWANSQSEDNDLMEIKSAQYDAHDYQDNLPYNPADGEAEHASDHETASDTENDSESEDE